MSWARIYGPDPAKEQMDRILRWHSHLKKAADTRADLVEIVDLALTVLLHCYHFKEWLVPGTGFNTLPTCVQDAYSEVDLRLCQAVANGQKHFRLNNQTIIDVDYMIAREWEPAGPPSRELSIAVRRWFYFFSAVGPKPISRRCL